MTNISYSRNQIESTFVTLIKEGLIDSEDRLTMPSGIYSRAGVSINVNRKGRVLISELVREFQKDKFLSTSFSNKELENEIIDSVLEAALALDKGKSSIEEVVTTLLNRLNSERDNWLIILPIIGIELFEGAEIRLAGGAIRAFTEEDSRKLNRDAMDIWSTLRYEDVVRQKRISELNGVLKDILSSSKVWFQTSVEGKREAAYSLALESCTLALDVLRFFALYVGIDPDTTALAIPTEGRKGKIDYLQFKGNKMVVLGGRLGEIVHPYTLDIKRLEKLVNFQQFKIVQEISAKINPNEVENKILLAIQQFGEASRLNSSGAKLQWYLSTLETILAKENDEYRDRGKKVSRRLALLIGNDKSKSKIINDMDELYKIRQGPVHYGHRNRVGSEIVTKQDIADARFFAYLGTLRAIEYLSKVSSHDDLLNALDTQISRGIS